MHKQGVIKLEISGLGVVFLLCAAFGLYLWFKSRITQVTTSVEKPKLNLGSIGK